MKILYREIYALCAVVESGCYTLKDRESTYQKIFAFTYIFNFYSLFRFFFFFFLVILCNVTGRDNFFEPNPDLGQFFLRKKQNSV
jgi:hypothetical protein